MKNIPTGFTAFQKKDLIENLFKNSPSSDLPKKSFKISTIITIIIVILVIGVCGVSSASICCPCLTCSGSVNNIFKSCGSDVQKDCNCC